jgi:hypothetical protein
MVENMVFPTSSGKLGPVSWRIGDGPYHAHSTRVGQLRSRFYAIRQAGAFCSHYGSSGMESEDNQSSHLRSHPFELLQSRASAPRPQKTESTRLSVDSI